jgi:sulfur-oxidizing protein SoxZ
MSAPLINVPKSAKRGEIIAIKTLISHEMETGFRYGSNGVLIPRNIITEFVCTYNGDEIFRANFYPAVAANPFLTFYTVAAASGKFAFQWTGDNGYSETATAEIVVE